MQTSKRPTQPDLILLLIARSIPKNSLTDGMVVHCRVTPQHFFNQYALVDRGGGKTVDDHNNNIIIAF